MSKSIGKPPTLLLVSLPKSIHTESTIKEYEIMETVYCEQCNNFKALLYGQAEVDAHFSNGHGGGYRSYEYQRGTGEYETCVAYYEYVEKEVLVQEAYWEEVYE